MEKIDGTNRTNRTGKNILKGLVRKLFFSEQPVEGKTDKSWEKSMFSEMNRLRGRLVVMRSR